MAARLATAQAEGGNTNVPAAEEAVAEIIRAAKADAAFVGMSDKSSEVLSTSSE